MEEEYQSYTAKELLAAKVSIEDEETYLSNCELGDDVEEVCEQCQLRK